MSSVHQHVAGVDEAGRGPLAGPVAAAAVILRADAIPPGLADSKTLSADEREALFERICADAIAIAVAFASPAAIERRNIRGATLDAMRRAVDGLAIRPDFALIDGRDVPPGLPCPARAIIGGDGSEPAISAASIIAKVTRDRLMTRVAAACPDYGFERHMGYGTAAHRAAIEKHGPCEHHRLGFGLLKAWRDRGT